MNILFLSYKRNFINPTRELLVDAITQRPGIVTQGPGYGPLLPTIAQMQRQFGSFDAIVVDGAYYFDWGRQDGVGVGSDRWPSDLFDCGLPLIVFHILDDAHGHRQGHFEKLRSTGAFVLSPSLSKQIWRPPGPEEFRREAWLKPDSYIAQHPDVFDERYLLFPHCLAPEEFVAPQLDRAIYDVSVLGTGYYFRKQASAYINSHRELRNPRFAVLVQKVIAEIAVRHGYLKGLYKERFRRIIHRSLTSITCGGTIGYPLRKFFEIPAFGSILLAEFFRAASELGFRDGETCFHLDVNRLERIGEIIRMLKTDRSVAERIAFAGQQMIRENHTVAVRVRQFFEIVEAVVNRSLVTAHWQDGRMVLVRSGRA